MLTHGHFTCCQKQNFGNGFAAGFMSAFTPWFSPWLNSVYTQPFFFNSFSFTNFTSFSMPIWDGNYKYNNDFSLPSLPQLQTTNFNTQITNDSFFSNSLNNFYTGNFDTFTYTVKTNKKTNLPKTIPANYNETLGLRLSQRALSNAQYRYNEETHQVTTEKKESSQFTGMCAAYVKMAIRDVGLGSYQSGHAYQLTEILSNNRNFVQISPDGIDVKTLPAGCVIVYDRGAQGYNKDYGHAEITIGDGRAVSDGITTKLDKKPSAIFVPITA